MSFTYTDSFTPDSSAVEKAYYDAESSELAVVLNSGDTYVYESVPSWEWRALKTSYSTGRHFATVIKPNYGPGEALGYTSDSYFEKYGAEAADMGPVTNVSIDSSGIRVSGSGTFSGVVPKNLTLAPDATETFSLVSDAKNTREHVVSFTSGFDTVRTYAVQAASVEDAKAEVEELGEALGVDLVVKGVYVSFA